MWQLVLSEWWYQLSASYFLSHFQLEGLPLVHQFSSEIRKGKIVWQQTYQDYSCDSREGTERQPSPSPPSVMTTMYNNSIQTPAPISCTTVTHPQHATGITTTAIAATPTSRVQQPLSSEACSVSNLRLVCEVHNATTGSIIKGANTTVYRDIVIKKKYSSVPSGTPLCVQVKANRGCYIYIINIGSSGKVSTLIPNEYEPQNYLTSDTTLVFPSKEADYEFELDNHSGQETLVLLAYSTQCNTEQVERDCLRLKEDAPTYRDITIKKKISQAPSNSCCDQRNLLGFLEVQFSVKWYIVHCVFPCVMLNSKNPQFWSSFILRKSNYKTTPPYLSILITAHPTCLPISCQTSSSIINLGTLSITHKLTQSISHTTHPLIIIIFHFLPLFNHPYMHALILFYSIYQPITFYK